MPTIQCGESAPHRSVAEQLLAVCAEERLREHLRLRSSSAWPFRCAPASSASSAIVRYDALSVSAALSPPCLPPLHLSPSAPFTLCTSLTLSPCDAKLCEAPVSDALRYAHARYTPHTMQAKQPRSFFCTLVLLGAAAVCAVLTTPPVSARRLHAAGRTPCHLLSRAG